VQNEISSFKKRLILEEAVFEGPEHSSEMCNPWVLRLFQHAPLDKHVP